MARPIVVVDYHKGNLSSVERGLAEAGGTALVTDDPAAIARAGALVRPGVGRFGDAMAYLRESGQDEAILSAVGRGAPFLGICLGLQLLFERGTETADVSAAPGLGVLPGSATRLESSRLKVPHVGWDQLDLTRLGRSCPLFAGVAEGDAIVTARTHYARSFASAVWDEKNVYGVQFHPEKSSAVGLQILRSFVRLTEGAA